MPNQRWLMAIHITSNLLGGGILLVAGCASAFYLVNERRLKSRRALGQGPKLPPLESLDAVVHRLLWIGLPCSPSACSPAAWSSSTPRSITAGDKFRAALSGASWLVLLAVLVLRQFASWRGRRPAYATLGGRAGDLRRHRSSTSRAPCWGTAVIVVVGFRTGARRSRCASAWPSRRPTWPSAWPISNSARMPARWSCCAPATAWK
jgi:hypothetical protein